MGSKSRIAKYIVPIIQQYIDTNKIDTYIEPFVGGANVIDKIKCKNKYGYDKNQFLIALLNKVKSKESLLTEVPREFYNDVRANQNNNKYEDWIVGNVGFLASYNGRWFDGGYAQSGYEKTKTGERFRNYYQEAKNNILAQTDNIQDCSFKCQDYSELNINYKGCLIYCDPPYQGTKQYSNALAFDYDKFWNTMREWSKNNIVLVSE